ncbi:hypothetical protein MLD38_002125 [Melastoma candidum]|uniref:Uncharacterized protein n=1 Tax=Melastoma candidum TaxID=119954 RepID=A0ACB9SH10_9MYRT|nr:hypothetical protein MLD38_002125 [Melastoma candidum]
MGEDVDGDDVPYPCLAHVDNEVALGDIAGSLVVVTAGSSALLMVPPAEARAPPENLLDYGRLRELAGLLERHLGGGRGFTRPRRDL